MTKTLRIPILGGSAFGAIFLYRRTKVSRFKALTERYRQLQWFKAPAVPDPGSLFQVGQQTGAQCN